jgi:hypothetical protein
MTMEPATLTVTGLIATGLSLIFAIAAHSTSKKRQRERAHLEAALRAQQEPVPAPAAYPEVASSLNIRETPDVMAVRTQPAVTMTAERPHAPVPLAPAPAPVAQTARVQAPLHPAPSVFKQYLTRPGTKATTPVVETSPTDKDYVWE